MISAESSLTWWQKGFLTSFNLSTDTKTRWAARAVLKSARSNLVAQGLYKSGDMYKALKLFKSKNTKFCYLVGVFHQATSEWEDSLGARAVFNEYGHAFPYRGRKWVRKREDIKKEVPARPFLRPALDGNVDLIKSKFHLGKK